MYTVVSGFLQNTNVFSQLSQWYLQNMFVTRSIHGQSLIVPLENEIKAHRISGFQHTLSVQPVCFQLYTRYHFSTNKVVVYIKTFLTIKLV